MLCAMGELALKKPAGTRRRDSRLKKVETVFDGWGNTGTGLGGKNSRNKCNKWSARNQLPLRTLEHLYAQNALIARMVDREPDDATSEGFDLRGLSPDEQSSMEDWLEDLQVLQSIADGQRWGLLFSGGAAYMQIDDGRPPEAPVDEMNIIAIRNIHVFERQDLTAQSWSLDLGSKDFGKPRVYNIRLGGAMFDVHASRLLLFDGIRTSRQLRISNDGFGASHIDQVWDQFTHWCTTHEYAAEVVTEMTQGALKLKGLAAAMKSGNSKLVRKRIQSLMRGMSVLGKLVLDEGEDYTVTTRSMTGFKEILESFENALVAVSPQPKSLLFGRISGGGFNNGEARGEWKSWEGYIRARRTLIYTPAVRKVLRYGALSRLTPFVSRPERLCLSYATPHSLNHCISVVFANLSNGW